MDGYTRLVLVAVLGAVVVIGAWSLRGELDAMKARIAALEASAPNAPSPLRPGTGSEG